MYSFHGTNTRFFLTKNAAHFKVPLTQLFNNITFQEILMNKNELVNALSEETAFSKKDISKVLASFTRIIERTLKKGDKVSLTGFGTYWISRRPARTGINPATKERITLPAISVPRFKPGKRLRDEVRHTGR